MADYGTLSGRPLFWNRQGEPISIAAADELLQDPEYRRVAWDDLGHIQISTIWLGCNFNIANPGGPRLLFETMTFDGTDAVLRQRYPTKETAQAGHDRIVAELRHG